MNETTRTMKEAEGESGGNTALMCLPLWGWGPWRPGIEGSAVYCGFF